MSLFGKSAQEKEIIALTDETLRESDVAGNLQLADTINRSPDDGKEILKLLFKRVKHRNPHVQLLSLNLLDLLVKNSHTAFHQHLAQKSYLKECQEIVLEKKCNPQVRDLLLTLLETWSEAFMRPNEFQLPIFNEYYSKLKRKGVEFPARDMAALAPVLTPHIKPQRKNSGVPLPPQSSGPYTQEQIDLNYQRELQQQYGSPGSHLNVYPNALQSPPHLSSSPLYQSPSSHPQQSGNYQPQHPSPNLAPQSAPNSRGSPAQQQNPNNPAAQKLSPTQIKLFQQCTYLSNEYVEKLKQETLLTFDYINLLKDISSAADSSASLKSDSLASNLSRVLIEVRNRYTKLILELGDIDDPSAAAAAEFIIDLSIHMIDSIRIILDYFKLSCEGVRIAAPEINIPRSLTQQQAPPVTAVPIRQPATMQLFDMPAPSEDDEKQVAANVFAANRNAVPAATVFASSSPAAATSASPPYVSPSSFQAADSFTPATAFAPSLAFNPEQVNAAQASSSSSSSSSSSLSPARLAVPPVAPSTPFDELSPNPSSSSSSSFSSASSASSVPNAFDQLAPMRSAIEQVQQQRPQSLHPSSMSQTPGGPSTAGEPSAAQVPEVVVPDSFLDEIFKLTTVKQKQTEGEQ